MAINKTHFVVFVAFVALMPRILRVLTRVMCLYMEGKKDSK